jgi:hypothetical protein
VAAAAQLNVTGRYLTATATERNAGIFFAAVIGVGFIALVVYMYLDTGGAPCRPSL